jgi:glycosyltransferase involved in cell wall biosynthesis
MSPCVSVVIPLYNCARTIEATIRSVQAQSFADWEIVAVDDASPDHAPALVEAMAAADPRIRLLRNGENRGIAATCNHGARESRGRFIATLDSDDVWAPTKLEAQLAAIERVGPECGFAWCPFQRIDAADRVLFSAPFVPVEGWGFLPIVAYNFVGNGSALLARREAIEDVGGFMENKGAYSSDDLLILLLLAGRWKMACAPEYLVGYRLVSGSTSSVVLRGAHSYLRVLEIVEARYPEAPPATLRACRAEILARYALYHAEVGRLREAAGRMAEAFRADPRCALQGIVYWLRQRASGWRARLSGRRGEGIGYFDAANDRRALVPLRGVKARQVARAAEAERAFRAGLGDRRPGAAAPPAATAAVATPGLSHRA